MDLDELQEEAEKLLMLLKDRQYGLMSWNMMLARRIDSLKRVINEESK